MRIKAISIENFKAFPKVKIECNENFNFIVGENNIGKSTILEAIQLWKAGYDAIVQNNIYQTRPIFHSIKKESFYNNAQLMKKISLGKSHEVIRNS
jgi:predicted ATP-dependent endonuclease of OLD family